LALATLRIDVNGLMRDGDLLGRLLDTFVTAQLRAQLAGCESQPRLFHLRQEKGGGAVLHAGPRAFMLDERVAAAPMSVLWA
jgi:hypothetical protein